jgi:hypothetical protein
MAGIIKCYNNSCPAFNADEVNNCNKPLTKSNIQKCPEGKIQGDRDPKPASYYGRILILPECACGKPKKRGMAFCYNCFIELPKLEKSLLYKRVGQGFEQAYESAIRYLERDVW